MTHIQRASTFFVGAMVALCMPLAAYAADNLILNPSLETAGTGGQPASWTKTFWGTPTPTFTYPVAGHTGNGAAISFAANSNGDARWQHAPVAVTAGQQYTFSIWYKSTAATEINMEFSTATGGSITYGWLATLPSSNDVWTQYTGTFTVPTGKARVAVFQLLDKTGSLTIDDVSFSGGSTPPPPATPTATISANPMQITSGQASTLTWSSTNTTGCTASGAWSGAKGTSGTQSVSPTTTATYTLSCTGAGGSASANTTITVSAQPPPTTPTVTLSANPTAITAGQSSTLTWSSTNATSCTASGAWTGTKATSGTQAVSPTTTATYSLSCAGASSSASANTTVTVSAQPPPPTGGFTEGMVSFTFDDSWATQHTNAMPILQAAGIKGTFYLATQPIQEAWDEFMTTAQVQDIANKGHEIAGHTVTHADLTTLSQTRMRTEVVNSKNYLQTLTGQTVTSFAYPYGALNNTVKTVLRNNGYTSGRGVEYDNLNTATTDKYALNSMCVETSNPVSEIKAEIDKAKANKQWFILCAHEVKNVRDQYTMTPAKLQEIVDYVKSTGIKVVTVKQGRALLAP